jgi:hypothetical protein
MYHDSGRLPSSQYYLSGNSHSVSAFFDSTRQTGSASKLMQEYGHYYMEKKTGKSLFNSQLALPTNRLSTSDAVAGKLLHRGGRNWCRYTGKNT